MTFAWGMTGHLARTGLLLGLFGLCAPLFGADDSYLNQLKSEATATEVDQEETDSRAADADDKPAANSTTPFSGQHNYLQGLTDEAGTTQVDDSGQIATRELESAGSVDPPKSAWDIDSQSLDYLQAGLERDEFETILKQNYYASYVFYKKLDPTSKSLVYKTYLKSPAIQVVRNQIISLSK
ncbi:MAG: hypothetical protein ACLFQT_06525 [Thiohalophilus sp.]